MRIELQSGAGRNVIRSYRSGQIAVNQESFTGSLIVTPERVADWRPRSFSDLTIADFETLAALAPEVALLGTGSRLQFPSAQLTRPLIIAGIGFEIMDTGAACRTYNVLMSEGRRVAAALLIID